MDCGVIRVRYQDISYRSHHGTGLYGTAQRCPQGVTIYLVPRLTAGQRKAVIRRLRQEASRGCGPELPLPELIVALGADRVRVAVKLTAAAVRLHPATTLVPTGLVAIGMMMLVLTSAGVQPELAVAAGRAGASHAGSAVRRGNGAGDGSAGFDAADSLSGGAKAGPAVPAAFRCTVGSSCFCWHCSHTPVEPAEPPQEHFLCRGAPVRMVESDQCRLAAPPDMTSSATRSASCS